MNFTAIFKIVTEIELSDGAKDLVIMITCLGLSASLISNLYK